MMTSFFKKSCVNSIPVTIEARGTFDVVRQSTVISYSEVVSHNTFIDPLYVFNCDFSISKTQKQLTPLFVIFKTMHAT